MKKTSPIPVKKVKPALKTYPNIRRKIRIPLPYYKLRYQSLKSNNPTYQNQMESHTQINFSIKGKIPGDATQREYSQTKSTLQRQKNEIHTKEARDEDSGSP